MGLQITGVARTLSFGQRIRLGVQSVDGAVGAACDRVVTGILLAALLLLPLACYPYAESAFSVPKATLLQALAVIALAATTVKLLAGQPIKLHRSPLDLPIAVYLALLLIGLLRASSLDGALFGTGGRADGFITLISAIALYFVAYNLPGARSIFRRALECVAITSALVAIEGIAETLGFSLIGFTPGIWDGRAFSTTGNPDFLGGLLTMAVPLPMVLLATGSRSRPARVLWTVAFGLILAGLYVSYTRSAWIGTVVALALLLILARHELRRVWRWPAVALALVFIFAALVEGGVFARLHQPLAAPQPNALTQAPAQATSTAGQETLRSPSALQRLRVIGDTSEGGSARLLFWQAALSVIRENPLLGAGYGNLSAITSQLPMKWTRIAPDLWVDKAHNVYLDQAVSFGIPGLLAYLWLLGAFGWAVWSFLRRGNVGRRRLLLAALLAGWVGYLAHLFFLFDTVDSLGLFWVLMGLAAREIGRPEKALVLRLRMPAVGRGILALAAVACGALLIYWVAQPLVAENYLWRGQTAATQHHVDQAIGDYLKAAAINPYSEPTQTQAAIALAVMAAGESNPANAKHLLDESVRRWDLAIQRDKGYAYLYAMRAETYMRYANGEHLRDAQADFRQAVALYPNYYNALAGVADTAHLTQSTSEAVAMERRMLEIKPDDQAVLRVLAQDYVRGGRIPEALATWERLIAVAGDDANLRLSMAQALIMSGDKVRGRTELERARALDPNNQQVQQALQSLQ